MLVANENFVEAVQSIAQAAGVPNLPYVVFPTNIDGLPEEQIVAMGEARLDEMVAKLVSQTAESLTAARRAG